MHHATRNRPHQRGNILFLILLAIVLFVALTNAVMQGMRGGGKSASAETLQAEVARIQNYGIEIQTALNRVTLVSGLDLWQINYSSQVSGSSAASSNANCVSGSCRLFYPDGQNVNPMVLKTELRGNVLECANVSSWAGRHWFRNIGVAGKGLDTKRELVLTFQGIGKSLCEAVNTANGVQNPSNIPPIDTAGNTSNYSDYSGTLSSEVTVNGTIAIGNEAADIASAQMFCVRENIYGGGNPGCYNLYYVLVER